MRARIAAALLLVSTSAMAAGSSAGYGDRPPLIAIDPVVNQYNASGAPFRIEGHCYVACTLFLSIRNVCIHPSARLYFHAGPDRQHRIPPEIVHRLMGAYNDSLRSYLRSSRAWDKHEFTVLWGSDLVGRFGYRRCPQA
jgi:hypothetical protein